MQGDVAASRAEVEGTPSEDVADDGAVVDCTYRDSSVQAPMLEAHTCGSARDDTSGSEKAACDHRPDDGPTNDLADTCIETCEKTCGSATDVRAVELEAAVDVLAHAEVFGDVAVELCSPSAAKPDGPTDRLQVSKADDKIGHTPQTEAVTDDDTLTAVHREVASTHGEPGDLPGLEASLLLQGAAPARHAGAETAATNALRGDATAGASEVVMGNEMAARMAALSPQGTADDSELAEYAKGDAGRCLEGRSPPVSCEAASESDSSTVGSDRQWEACGDSQQGFAG